MQQYTNGHDPGIFFHDEKFSSATKNHRCERFFFIDAYQERIRGTTIYGTPENVGETNV